MRSDGARVTVDLLEAYDIGEHRHRFASWAAARATQRGWGAATTPSLVAALELTKLPSMLRSRAWPSTSEQFDPCHLEWCTRIINELGARGLDTSYGRAAKLVAIYIKTLVVVGGFHDSQLAAVAHPPIDAILLRSIAGLEECAPAARKLWRTTRWTQMDQKAYVQLIASIRAEGLDQPAFWMIERHWDPG